MTNPGIPQGPWGLPGYMGGGQPPPPSGGGGFGGVAPPPAAAPPAPGGGAPGGGAQGGGRQLPGGPLNPGDQHPFSNDPFALIGPPGTPGAAYNNFIPDILRNPYLSGLNAAAQVGTAAGQALPGAAGFHSQLYNPSLNPMEQAFLGASADLGMRGLQGTLNQIGGQFENSPMHSALGPMMMNAANQFASQMMQTGAGMGLQRQQMATSTLPFTFGFPLQAAGFGQQSAEGLLNMANQAMYGDLQFPTSIYSQTPYMAPTIMASQGGGAK